MHDLQPLGVFDAGRKTARQVRRHVVAAEADSVRMNELAFGKDRDRRRAAAHVDRGTAELDFVVDERCKTASIGGRHHALDREVSAVDAEFQVLERCTLGRQHMHVDAENVAEHGERITDAAFAIEREARRQ
ncbi:hypothetical protein D9M68_449860 [compost metagenome]